VSVFLNKLTLTIRSFTASSPIEESQPCSSVSIVTRLRSGQSETQFGGKENFSYHVQDPVHWVKEAVFSGVKAA